MVNLLAMIITIPLLILSGGYFMKQNSFNKRKTTFLLGLIMILFALLEVIILILAYFDY